MILSRHAQFDVICEYNEEEIHDDDDYVRSSSNTRSGSRGSPKRASAWLARSRCRAKLQQISQSRPDSGLGLSQVSGQSLQILTSCSLCKGYSNLLIMGGGYRAFANYDIVKKAYDNDHESEATNNPFIRSSSNTRSGSHGSPKRASASRVRTSASEAMKRRGTSA